MSQSADSDMAMLGNRVSQVSMVDCYGLGLVIQITDGQWGHTGFQRGLNDSCSLSQPHIGNCGVRSGSES